MSDKTGPNQPPPRLCSEAIMQASDAIYLTDTDGTIEYVNPAFEELTGYAADEAIGKTPRILKSGEQDESFYDELWETITAQQQWESEFINETKGGKRIVLSQQITPVTLENNGVEQTKYLAVAHDITERKHAKEKLELFSDIQARVLRHNLRNKLTVIKLHAEQSTKAETDRHAEMGEEILSATNELISITEKTQQIEQILKNELTPVTIDIGSALQRIVEMYRREFPLVSFSLRCPDHYTLEIIPEMKLAFDELIGNAARHNDASEPTVDITVTTEPSTTVIISDNGPGIPEEELTALQNERERPLNHSTGVGLWVVNWVLEYSSASIDFDSDPGTKITIRFTATE